MRSDMTLVEFCHRTAARMPTPGGGSVAAYVASLGAALGMMTARFTEGRKGFEEHAATLAAEIDRLETTRGRMLELMESDAAAYEAVTAAYRLPKATDAEKATRREAIQSSLRGAMDVPLQACREVVGALEVLDSLRHHANPNLVSDVAVGAYALGAAFRSAWINVLINLGSLPDDDLRARVAAEGAELSARVDALETEVGSAIVESLTS